MPRLVGINHIAVEVGDLDEAIAFFERIFDDVILRGRAGNMAFLDMGDQFVALESVRRAGLRQATSGSSSTIAMRPFAGRARGVSRSPGATISSTPGGTAGRSSTTATSSSRRRLASSTAWGSPASRSPSAHSRSSARGPRRLTS